MFETEFSFSLVSEIAIILGLLQDNIKYHDEGSGSWVSFLCYNGIE